MDMTSDLPFTFLKQSKFIHEKMPRHRQLGSSLFLIPQQSDLQSIGFLLWKHLTPQKIEKTQY